MFGVTSMLLGACRWWRSARASRCLAGRCATPTPWPTRSFPPSLWTPVATVTAVVVYAALTVIAVRVLSLGLSRGLPPRAQPGRLAGVGHRAPDGRRPQLPVPDLRQPADAVVAAPARRENRSRNRDLDGAAHPEVHRRRGRRLPRRRHHGGVLRTRRRLDPRRQGDHRQARVPRQLRNHPARPARARRRAGRRAECDAAQGEGGLVVAGQSADPAAPPADGRRRAAHLPPVARG